MGHLQDFQPPNVMVCVTPGIIATQLQTRRGSTNAVGARSFVRLARFVRPLCLWATTPPVGKWLPGQIKAYVNQDDIVLMALNGCVPQVNGAGRMVYRVSNALGTASSATIAPSIPLVASKWNARLVNTGESGACTHHIVADLATRIFIALTHRLVQKHSTVRAQISFALWVPQHQFLS